MKVKIKSQPDNNDTKTLCINGETFTLPRDQWSEVPKEAVQILLDAAIEFEIESEPLGPQLEEESLEPPSETFVGNPE